MGSSSAVVCHNVQREIKIIHLLLLRIYTFLFSQVSPKKLYWFCMGRFGAKIRINDVVRKVENAQRKSQNYCLLLNVILYHENRVESIIVCNKQFNIVTKAHIQFSCKPYKFGFQDLSFIRW